MSFLGALICKWKGHREKRIADTLDPLKPRYYNRECTRCGARRLAPARKKN